MAKSEGQKLKLLYIIQMLEDNSDENHPITTAELIEKLESLGIHAERKSIYDDIAKLCDFGYDIIQMNSRAGGGYYLASREFELPELKLLVDAVQSSRFITTKKSRELIRKLEKKAGKYDAKKLQRQVYVAGRVKTENEGIYYSTDKIHGAIQGNKQIQFQYLDWNLKKSMTTREKSEKTVSPWALIWKEENYYLIAYDAEAIKMKHYRVDKIGELNVLEIAREGVELFRTMDLATYVNRSFGMYGGEDEIVTLEFPNRLVGVVIDRFGKEIAIRPKGEDTFRVRVQVTISGQFFGWLAGIGKDVQIVSPKEIRSQYLCWITDIMETMQATD